VRPAPLRGRGALAVLKWATQCHGADTGLVAQSPTVVGMGSPQGVGGTAPGRDSQAHDGAALPCQSIKCSLPRAGAGALARDLERGGTRSRGRLIGPLWRAVGATATWAAPCVRAQVRGVFCFIFCRF
jgi:hypothetical protein